MTISNTTTKKVYSGNGIATVFAYDFIIQDEAELEVYLEIAGTLTLQTISTDYTVSGVGLPAGGNVTFVSAPDTGTSNILLLRATPLTQEVDYIEGDEFPADTHEGALDKLTRITQELQEAIDRAVKVAANDSTTPDELLAAIDAAVAAAQLAETNAETAETNAETAETNAAASASAAATSEASAATSETNASASASAAATSETNASASAAAALTSENNAETAETNAETAATNAAVSAAAALTSENNAATSETNAATSEANAAASASQAAASASTSRIRDIDAAVAGNALTITINPQTLDFRSATLTDGTPQSITIPSAVSVVVPNTATLGTINGQAARLAVLAINNAGSIEVGAVNLAGGNQLDETNLISTTTIGTGADSSNVIYSTTGRSNVPYRVVGFIDITEATAGVWATAPTLVQGGGGQSLIFLSSFGYGDYVNVTASRAFSTTYYNTSSKSKEVIVSGTGASAFILGYLQATVNGVALGTQGTNSGTAGGTGYPQVSFTVPPKGSYSVAATNATLTTWVEK